MNEIWNQFSLNVLIVSDEPKTLFREFLYMKDDFYCKLSYQIWFSFWWTTSIYFYKIYIQFFCLIYTEYNWIDLDIVMNIIIPLLAYNAKFSPCFI